ncbi:MAG: hypothetical protein ACOX60_05075 [Massiliimalia sp.]|jgi:hypothetical protein
MKIKKVFLLAAAAVLVLALIFMIPVGQMWAEWNHFEKHGGYLVTYDGQYPDVEEKQIVSLGTKCKDGPAISQVYYYPQVPQLSFLARGDDDQVFRLTVSVRGKDWEVSHFISYGGKSVYGQSIRHFCITPSEPLKSGETYTLTIMSEDANWEMEITLTE